MSKISKCQHEPRDEDITTDTDTTAEKADEEERDDAHLDGVEVGAGCTEIWEHLAEQREE